MPNAVLHATLHTALVVMATAGAKGACEDMGCLIDLGPKSMFRGLELMAESVDGALGALRQTPTAFTGKGVWRRPCPWGGRCRSRRPETQK